MKVAVCDDDRAIIEQIEEYIEIIHDKSLESIKFITIS